jgi:hypothetical protein
MPRPSAPPPAKSRVATPQPAAKPEAVTPPPAAKPRVVVTPPPAATATPAATAVAPRATAAAPIVRSAPVTQAAPPVRDRAKRHKAVQRATPMPTPTATATATTAESEWIVTVPPKPAADVRAREEGGDGRRVAIAGLKLLGLALISASLLILTQLDRRSPRT